MGRDIEGSPRDMGTQRIRRRRVQEDILWATIIPPRVATQEVDYPRPAEFGIESGRFYFLFSFDFYSFPHRKNPLGVLNAFRMAFPDLNENVGLIIKSTGSEAHQADVWKEGRPGKGQQLGLGQLRA
jgi:hypothetical protein